MLRRRRGEADEPAAPAAQPAATPSTAGNRYRMVEKLVSIGDDFFIENDQGQRAFKVDGKAVRVRDTLIFRDMQGNEVCKIQEQIARVRDSMEIEGPDGQRTGDGAQSDDHAAAGTLLRQGRRRS